MRLVDLDAKEPYVLDGRYVVDTVPKATILYSLDSFNKSVPSTELMESCNRARSLFEGKEKHGRWVKNEEGDYHCSECKAIVESDEKSRHYWGYCYNCGARMETEEMME